MDLDNSTEHSSSADLTLPQREQDSSLHAALSVRDMSLLALADGCMNEIESFRRGEPFTDQYGRELFRRALKQCDPLAWEIVQQCFKDMMVGWLRKHPMRRAVSCFNSDEHYIAQAFIRCWQVVIGNPKVELLSLAAMVQCLQASLHGVLLDTLRIFARPREVPLPECNGSEESLAGEQVRGRELWEFIQRVFPDRRQRRVAYLLFHCHLKPQEIVRFCPDEFRDEEEIRRLRRSIFERLLPNTDPIQ